MRSSGLSKSISHIHAFLVRHELKILGIFLIVSLLQLWLTRYVPSMDGAQHIYSANVIVHLLKGNQLFQEFFQFNNMVVGYWTGHFVLGLFKLFFPAWLAEKLMLSLYVLGMFFSFRYLVQSILPGKGNLLIFLVFPFIFHSYMLLGYYNFSIAVIFFFWALGYWIRKRDRFEWQEMLIMGSIVLGLFLSHGLVFLFFAGALLLFYLTTSINIMLEHPGRGSSKNVIQQGWRLGVSVLPALVLWFFYILRVMEIDATVSAAGYGTAELVKGLLRIRQLVGFHNEMESPAYVALFVIITILAITTLWNYLMGRMKGELHWHALFHPRYAFMWITIAFLMAYFLAPDRISAGSLTHRFGLFFFLSLVVLIAVQRVPEWLQILTMLVLLGSMGYSRTVHHRFYGNLNDDIREIQEMTPFMEEQTTVLYLNSSDNWVHRHFQLYAVDNKAIVHLQNPQCAGQFPLVWNGPTLPECYTGPIPYRPGGTPDISAKGHRRMEVDYITIFYLQQFWENEENEKWQKILTDHYEEVMVTSRGRAALYHRK